MLLSAGLEPPAGGRMRCPLHGGPTSSPSSFAFDDRRWHCFRGCGGGDAIQLARELFALDFRGALLHCAALTGTGPSFRTADEAWRAAETRARAAAEREAATERHRALFQAALDDLREAREDAALLAQAYGRPGAEPGPSAALLLDALALADPFMREILAHERLNEVEAAWRVARGAR